VNLGPDSLGKSNDLGVSSVSRIHFGFGFIVNPDWDPIIEEPLIYLFIIKIVHKVHKKLHTTIQ